MELHHPDEPHTHTVTFTDNDGTEFTFEHDCPATREHVRERMMGTGAESVNGLTVDGKVLEFEIAFSMLGQLGLMPMLGQSYMTLDNLMTLLEVEAAMQAAKEESTA